jgi:hypothetical protein
MRLGVLLLSVLLVQLQAQGLKGKLPWPYNDVPSLGSLGSDICTRLGKAALPFAANSFCNGTGFTTPGLRRGLLLRRLLNNRCAMLGYAEHVFQAFSKANATCPAAKQTPAATVSLNGESS